MIKATKISMAIVTLGVTVSAAFAQNGYYEQPRYRSANPDAQTYGPGTYTEGGRSVSVPRQCYASREQRLEGGQLVWRPLVTCPFDDYR